jgi:hypothetical protein
MLGGEGVFRPAAGRSPIAEKINVLLSEPRRNLRELRISQRCISPASASNGAIRLPERCEIAAGETPNGEFN